MSDLRLTIEGLDYEYARGLSLATISRDFARLERGPIVGARIGHDLRDLWYCPTGDAAIEWIDLTRADGTRIYARSLSFILIRAVRELFPEARVTIEHSLCKGIYGEIHHGRDLTEEDLTSVAGRMAEIIARDEPIVKSEIPLAEAIELFARDGQEDKVRLLKHRTVERGQGLPMRRILRLFLRLYRPQHGFSQDLRSTSLPSGIHPPVPSTGGPVRASRLCRPAQTGTYLWRVRTLGRDP